MDTHRLHFASQRDKDNSDSGWITSIFTEAVAMTLSLSNPTQTWSVPYGNKAFPKREVTGFISVRHFTLVNGTALPTVYRSESENNIKKEKLQNRVTTIWLDMRFRRGAWIGKKKNTNRRHQLESCVCIYLMNKEVLTQTVESKINSTLFFLTLFLIQYKKS